LPADSDDMSLNVCLDACLMYNADVENNVAGHLLLMIQATLQNHAIINVFIWRMIHDVSKRALQL
jgi:hypothetical protein